LTEVCIWHNKLITFSTFGILFITFDFSIAEAGDITLKTSLPNSYHYLVSRMITPKRIE